MMMTTIVMRLQSKTQAKIDYWHTFFTGIEQVLVFTSIRKQADPTLACGIATMNMTMAHIYLEDLN